MVHFEVSRENADALAAALRGLESAGLRVNIAKSDGAGVPAGLRGVELELVGDDRVGIVSNLTRILAAHGISIENIHTEITRAASGHQTFKVGAHLLVPATISIDDLRRELGTLANEMQVDIGLEEKAPRVSPG
jgi:glycine cleavage system regulatory protein